MKRLIVLGVAVAAAMVVEEATQGRMLGQSRTVCQAVGGKLAIGRCVLPVCYWLGDCGQWAHPTQWLDRLKPGDSMSKVVFWLGEPLTRDGAYLSWSCGKARADSFRALFRDKRVVEVEPCRPD